AWREGHIPEMEAEIVDAAHEMAGRALDAGDPSAAVWAARQGLRVSPYDERLYRDLMRAADAMGNPQGVEAALDELVRALEIDVEPYDSLHPETIALYRRLSRRSAEVGRG
ncbi:MAG: bacterial transcriptional activator domain-containing protein, partial [Acidimicrobiales bacterium]